MNRRYVRFLFTIPFALILLALLYAGRLDAGAKPLVANGWNGAFYSSLSANGGVPDYGYQVDKKITGVPHLSLPGYAPIYFNPGNAPAYQGATKPGIAANPGNIPALAPSPTITMTPSPLTNEHPGGNNPAVIPLTGDVPGVLTLPALFTMEFFPLTIPDDGTTPSHLAINISEGGSGHHYHLQDMNFIDTLPAGLVISGGGEGTDCGVVSAPPGGHTITYTGGNALVDGTDCGIDVAVTSTTPGVYSNNSSNISGLSDHIDDSGASATLTVIHKLNPVDFTKLATTCKGSTFANVTGLVPPYNQVTINWGDVPGAKKYLVALIGQGNVPAWSGQPMILDAGEFDGTTASLKPDSKLSHDLLNAHGTFIIIVQAQNNDPSNDGICNISHIIFAVPAAPTSTPPPPPTWTPWPKDTGQRGKTCHRDPSTGNQICS